MRAVRLLVLATLVAGVTTVSMAQGRGGILQRRSDALTEQQRQSLRDLRQRHHREMTELRSRHREQMQRALPPAALQRMEQRRGQLQREGRLLERQRMARERRGIGIRGRVRAGR